MRLEGFDASTVETSGDFDALPAGWYQVVINATEERETKSGNGSYLLLEMDVIDGPREGRKVFDRLNLNNPNQAAVDIANRQLAAICQAVGVLRPKDSEELHDKPLEVKVVQKEYQGEMRNEVKAYRAVKGATSAPQQSRPSSQPQHQTVMASQSRAPWAR